jgi:hypothetical protein
MVGSFLFALDTTIVNIAMGSPGTLPGHFECSRLAHGSPYQRGHEQWPPSSDAALAQCTIATAAVVAESAVARTARHEDRHLRERERQKS